MPRPTTSQSRVRATCLTKAQLIMKYDSLELTCQKYQRLCKELQEDNLELDKRNNNQKRLIDQLKYYSGEADTDKIDSFSDAVLRAKLTMFVQNPKLRENAEYTIKRLLEEWVNRSNLSARRAAMMLTVLGPGKYLPRIIDYNDARQYFNRRCGQEDERRADLYFDSQHKD